MHHYKLSKPTIHTFTALLTTAKKASHITQLHAHLLTSNLLLTHPLLNTQLLNLYAQHGHLDQSLLLFDTSDTNVVAWTSLISHLARSHLPDKSLSFFSLLHRSPLLQPNAFTLSAAASACSAAADLAAGRQLHALALKLAAAPSDAFVASALAHMYARCSHMPSARTLFDEMPHPNLVSWNSLIAGYVANGLHCDALASFHRLLTEQPALQPDQVSFSSALTACANTGDSAYGARTHARVLKLGFETLYPYVKNSLLHFYVKCRRFQDAVQLFGNDGQARDVVTWNIMMMGYGCEEAMECFGAMRRECIPPDEASFSTALHASASLASCSQGAAIHALIIESGFSGHRSIGSSLITMYAKCGGLNDADGVFQDSDTQQTVVSWTAIISAHQQHGHGGHVLELFEEMLRREIRPDYVTFVSVLSACSHNGLVEQGIRYLDSMSRVHEMVPGSEHYSCIVDMLGRAGRLDEAKRVIDTMPIEPDASVLGALLGSCRNWGNLEMGMEVAEKLFKIEPDNPGNYVLLWSMYARHGRPDEAKEVWRSMGSSGVRKEIGCSWIEVKNKSIVFTVRDQTHKRMDEIYEILGKLLIHAQLQRKETSSDDIIHKHQAEIDNTI